MRINIIKNIAKKRRGFTLVELLVVIAIIGILATMVIINLFGAQAKARDSQRMSDIKQIQNAVEMAKEISGKYPGTPNKIYCSSKEGTRCQENSAPWVLKTESTPVFLNDIEPYLSPPPNDPKNKIDFVYRYANNIFYYEIDTFFEKQDNVLLGGDGGNSGYHYEVGTKLDLINTIPMPTSTPTSTPISPPAQ